ncbi:MAG: ATP-binding cassette domain-containing protein, partial [Sulfuricurvum sp.]
MGMLNLGQVSVSHNKRIAIKDASLTVNEGEIIGFIGADGAGKSSLMHAIAGVIRFEGEISFQNHIYHSPSEAEKLKSQIGLMPQGIGLVLYELLTVDEHLSFFANIRSIKQDERFNEYKNRLLRMAGLDKFVDRRAGNL